MPITTDPTDPRLGHGTDEQPVPQAEAYLVLSEEERAKGFVRPVRLSYRHVGLTHGPLRDLTNAEQSRYSEVAYVKFEAYPDSELPRTGRFWTQAQLDNKGCGNITTMGRELAETYARDPDFYGSTYCATCQKHLPVAEFTWVDDGTVVGS